MIRKPNKSGGCRPLSAVGVSSVVRVVSASTHLRSTVRKTNRSRFPSRPIYNILVGGILAGGTVSRNEIFCSVKIQYL